MNNKTSKSRMSDLPTGVMVALATPLDEYGDVDDKGLHCLLENLVPYSLSGVCPVGSTGEGPLLSRQSKVKVTAIVSEHFEGNAWNIPAVMSNTLDDAVEDLHAYADAGANAALVNTPFYYQHSPSAVANWYEAIIDRSPLPLLLYNIPQLTKNSIPSEVVASLAQDNRVLGMKDSSRDMEYFESILGATRDSAFSLLTGSDTLLLASGALGGSGTIAASVNLVPDIVVGLWNAILAGSWESARELQNKLLEIVMVCRSVGFPMGWKAALSLRRLCSANVAFPNIPASGSVLKKLALELASVGVDSREDL